MRAHRSHNKNRKSPERSGLNGAAGNGNFPARNAKQIGKSSGMSSYMGERERFSLGRKRGLHRRATEGIAGMETGKGKKELFLGSHQDMGGEKHLLRQSRCGGMGEDERLGSDRQSGLWEERGEIGIRTYLLDNAGEFKSPHYDTKCRDKTSLKKKSRSACSKGGILQSSFGPTLTTTRTRLAKKKGPQRGGTSTKKKTPERHRPMGKDVTGSFPTSKQKKEPRGRGL